jgi:hypothetical protein
LVLNGLGDAGEVEAIRNQIERDHGVRVVYDGADMSKGESVRGSIAATIEKFGRLDILVNNASIQFTAPVQEFPTAKWNAILEINPSAAFHSIATARVVAVGDLALRNQFGTRQQLQFRQERLDLGVPHLQRPVQGPLFERRNQIDLPRRCPSTLAFSMRRRTKTPNGYTKKSQPFPRAAQKVWESCIRRLKRPQDRTCPTLRSSPA